MRANLLSLSLSNGVCCYIAELKPAISKPGHLKVMKLPILSVPEENSCGCTENGQCLCSTTGLVQIMGRKYALRLLFLIGDRRVIRFSDLKSEMDDMSSSTLTIRLAELERAGLINRKLFAEIPPRVEYNLTMEGEDMRKSLFALSRFASRK